MSALQVYQDYYASLVTHLPMNEIKFIAELYSKRLLPGDLKSTIQAQQTSANRAMVFLDHVIESSVQNNDIMPFKTLLSIITEDYGDYLRKLAGDIRSSLDHLPSISDCGNSQLSQITTNVKARYRRKGLAKSSTEQDPWPPFHAQSYTNLSLIHKKIVQLQTTEENTMVARIRTEGNIHEIPVISSVRLNTVHHIFAPVTSDEQCPMCILIEGHPGIGKTTLAKEICLQWANNKILTSDKLLLLLILRDPLLQKITSTDDLMKYILPMEHAQPVLSYLHTSNGAGVTFIIDGFDELGNELRHTSFFRELIEGDTLPNARVVVTSRPSVSACLLQHVDRRIEILGFGKSSKEQYLNDALSASPSKLQTLKRYFQQYPNIDAMCCIPLNMVIIIFLCLVGSLPPTATQMFASFILHTVCRHLKRIEKVTEDEFITKIEDLPQPVHTALQHLQKVAFYSLLEDKIVFTMDDLPDMCRDDPTCYGLLQAVECYCSDEVGTPTKSFNFLHLGIQEYFAAKFVASLPEVEEYLLLQQSFFVTDNNVHLSNMWVMYCGITNGQGSALRYYLSTYNTVSDYDIHHNYHNEFTISEDILKDAKKNLYLFQCFQEVQSDTVYDISCNTDEINLSNHTLLPHHVVSLAFYLLKSHGKWKTLNLDGCHIGDNGINLLHHYLSGNVEDKQEVTTINLSENDLTSASAPLIADIITYLQPNSVLLSHNSITSVRDISTAVINVKTTKTLDMDSSYLTVQEAPALCDVMNCLEKLKLRYNELEDDGAVIMSEGLATTNTLKVLDISSNNITAIGATAIANSLRQNTSLEVLDIGNNALSQDGGPIAFAEAITENKTLKELLLYGDDTLDEDSVKTIIDSLHLNNTITKLELPSRLWTTAHVKREVEKINNRRSTYNVQELKVHVSDDDQKEYLKYLHKAKRKNMVVKFQHIKILLSGSAAAGKTSFSRLLFRSKFCSEYLSTDIMEAKRGMTITRKNYGILKQEDEILWLELDPKNQLKYFKTLLKCHLFQPSETHIDHLPQQLVNSSQQTQRTLKAPSTSSQQKIVPTTSAHSELHISHPTSAPSFETIQKLHELETDVDINVLNSPALPSTMKVGNTVKMITVLDTGGQPEYVMLLPAINSMPTINFVVHDLTKRLDEPVQVHYKRKGHCENPKYFLNYNNLDMIQLLMCLITDSQEQMPKEAPRCFSIPEKSYIGFVGTHYDKVNNEVVQSFNKTLSRIQKNRDCQSILSAENGIVFPVDNTTAGDSELEGNEVKRIRKRVESLTNKMKPKELPITWMILELELQRIRINSNRKYISYEEYKKTAKLNASIADEKEMKACLKYFHVLGIVVHFSDSESTELNGENTKLSKVNTELSKESSALSKWIIIDLQWLFTNLAKIMHLSLEDVDFTEQLLKDKFSERKLLAKELLECDHIKLEDISQEEIEYLFNILIHLKVITTVTIEQNEKQVEYYYLPCALPSTMQYSDSCRFLLSEPLLIRFSSGFLPRGFFCSLVSYLLKKQRDFKWKDQLGNTSIKHYSNVITFRLPDKSFLCLHDKIHYLEVQVRHYKRDVSLTYHSKILSVLKDCFSTVCQQLRLDFKKLEYGFLCHASYNSDDHMVVVGYLSKIEDNELEERELECTKDPSIVTQIGEAHKIWFKKSDESQQSDDHRAPKRSTPAMSLMPAKRHRSGEILEHGLLSEKDPDCSSVVDRIRKDYNDLLQLPIDFGILYSKYIITLPEKQKIDNITLNKEKNQCFFDEVLIPSLKVGMTEKYKAFIKVLEESDDSLLKFMAGKIGPTN